MSGVAAMTEREDGRAGRPDGAAIVREFLNGPVAILSCGFDWTVDWANRSAVQLLGADPTGHPLSDFLKDEPGSTSGYAMKSSLKQFNRPTGEPFWAFTAQSGTFDGHVLQIFEADDYVRERETLAYQESIFRHAIEAAEHARLGVQRQQ